MAVNRKQNDFGHGVVVYVGLWYVGSTGQWIETLQSEQLLQNRNQMFKSFSRQKGGQDFFFFFFFFFFFAFRLTLVGQKLLRALSKN